MKLVTLSSWLFLWGLALPALALDCGIPNKRICIGADNQFAGGFVAPSGHGGFGGGTCQAVKTPVVFIHGNADKAITWDVQPYVAPADHPVPTLSVYDEFKAQGYNDCELFGISYLNDEEREAPEFNYHRDQYQRIIDEFIQAVLTYTQKNKVDIVSHSLGVSMTLSSLTKHHRWVNVRRFINLAGAVRGLQSCLWLGYANPVYPVCGNQNLLDSYMFGFYPSTGSFFSFFGRNDWTGSSGGKSMRRTPFYQPDVDFYTLYAGYHDHILCSTLLGFDQCADGSKFNDYANVKAQLNVGAGSLAVQLDYDFKDESIFNRKGGDVDGVGHYNTKINTGRIIYNMLTTNCQGLNCGQGYSGPVN